MFKNNDSMRQKMKNISNNKFS